jgi:hypothetical protein
MERHVAGHATHFLRRLDRVADGHVELALALYRDVEVLREVLAHAKLPEGAERVAISLDDPRDGPFLVVTRTGHFVTCLGKGMAPGALPVVTRERIDVAASRVDRMRERVQRVRQLGEADEGEAGALIRRVQACGPYLPREDFEALARWEPLLGGTYTTLAAELEGEVVKTYPYLATLRKDRLRRADETLLAAWWDCFWAQSHFGLLMNVGDTNGIVSLIAEESREAVRVAMTITPMRFGIIAPAVRALWATGRQARALLPHFKRRPADNHLVGRATRDLGLAVIGHASSKSRAEAERALVTEVNAGSERARLFEIEWRDQVVSRLREGLARPREQMIEQLDTRARERVAEWAGDGHIEPPIPIASPADVPTDVARAALASLHDAWSTNPGWLVSLTDMLPWIARCGPEELVLPRAWARCFAWDDLRDDQLRLVEAFRLLFGGSRPQTVRQAAGPGRNDPCPCGSGKKHKKCCG